MFIEHIKGPVLSATDTVVRTDMGSILMKFSVEEEDYHYLHAPTNKAIIAKLREKAQHNKPVQSTWPSWGGMDMWEKGFSQHIHLVGPIQENSCGKGG